MLRLSSVQMCVACSSWSRLMSILGNEGRHLVTSAHAASAVKITAGMLTSSCLRRIPVPRKSASSDLLTTSVVSQVMTKTLASRSMNKEPKPKKGGKLKVHLTDEELSQIINIEGFRNQLNLIVERMRDNFVKQLSLRTSAGALDSLTVEFEGEKFSLNEVGQISRKNPNLIVINMSALPDAIRSVIEAIQKSGMNLNPQQEGTSIYVPLPQLTKEHRENLAKNAKSLFNQTRDELRDTQNRIIKNIKGKKGNFSDDLIFNSQLQVTSITDGYTSQAEEIMQKKQAELLGKES